MQVIFVPWLGGGHPIALICSVCRWKRRTRRSHVPVSIRKVLCVPGVLNLGSVQRIIDAIQVSQPFVLRARCWTYFQAGMLGHTLAFIAFVNTPQSWGRLLSWNRFPLMLWEWLAWRIFPRWHQQPMKYRGSISAVWPLQQGDLQEGQPRVSVFISLGLRPNIYTSDSRTGNERLHLLDLSLGQCSYCPHFSTICEFDGWQVIPAEQEKENFYFSGGKILVGVVKWNRTGL